MEKRGLLFLIIVFFLAQQAFAYSDLDLDVFLDKTVYGPDSNFKGNIIINYSGELSADDVLKGKILGCGDEQWKTIDLKTLLENEGINGFSEEYYSITSRGKTSLNHVFSNAGDFLFGFSLNKNNFYYIYDAYMKITGSGGPVSLDVGNDGVIEWNFAGDFIGWHNEIYYPAGVNENTPEMEIYSLVGSYSACEEIVIDPNRKYDPLDIRINAKINGSGGNYVNATLVDYGVECSFPLNQIKTNTFSNVYCDINLENPYYEEDNLTLEVCLITDGNYDVPVTSIDETGEDYYFVNLKRGRYNLIMDDDIVEFSGVNFIEALQEYMEYNCDLDDDSYCTIPVNLSMDSLGDISLSNLQIIGDTETNFFYDIEKIPGKKEINEIFIVSLESFDNLKTPSEKDECKLQLEFEDSESDLVNFSVSDVPIAKINVSSKYVATGIPITFDGSKSYSQNNNTISKWFWSFGDDVNASGKIVTHSYLSEGNYTVELIVEDNESVESNPAELVIYIGPLEDILLDLLKDVSNEVSDAQDYFDSLTGQNKEISDLLGFSGTLLDLNSSLEGLISNFSEINILNLPNESKDSRYKKIVEELEILKESIPSKLKIRDSLLVDNLVLAGDDDVPMYSLRDDSSYESDRAVYFFNIQNVNVDMEAYLIEVDYVYGEDEIFVLINKDVSCSGGGDRVVVEDVGVDLSKVKVLTEGYTLDDTYNTFYYSMSSSSISYSYLLNVDEISMINSVVFTDVEISSDDDDEEEEKAFPWIWYIILAIILSVGIYYFNFYTGPGSFKVKVNKASVKVFGKRLFTNEQDLNNLRNYVRNTLRKGFKKEDIKKVLLKKGWTNKQIEFAFKGKI